MIPLARSLRAAAAVRGDRVAAWAPPRPAAAASRPAATASRSLAATALLLVSSAGMAPAQELPDSAVELEPVVVRVLRSSVGAGVPYPVSVVAGEELRRAGGGAFLEEALRAVPGLQIQNRFNLASAERIMVRGFGARAQFGVRGIRVLVDGVPATLPDGQTALDHVDPFELERVELLRGPGSALYGNAAGGVLHLRSRDPGGKAGVEAEASRGAWGLATYRAAVTAPLGAAATRVSLSRLRFDGFRTDPLAEGGAVYGAAGRTVLNAVTDAPLAGGTLRVTANGLDMDAENPGSLSSSLLAEGRRAAYRFNVLQRTREDARQAQIGATWDGDLGALRGEVSLWGLRRDFTGLIPPAVVEFDRWAGGLRSIFRGEHAVGRARLSLGGGVEAEIQSDDRRNWENERGEKGALTLDQAERVRSGGAFLQARLESGRLSILAGLRADRARFRATDRFLADGTDDGGKRTMNAVSPSGGVVVEAGGGLEVFGSAGTFFQTPTTTELVNRPGGAGGFNPDLNPTRGHSLEAGVRWRRGARFAAEATVFRTSLRDELIPFEVPSAPGRSYFRNAGTSHQTGWEAAVDARSGAWSGRLAYTRVDARFDSYVREGDDLGGKRVPGVAPNRLDVRVAREAGAGFMEMRGLYQDAVPTNDANTAEAPPYFLASLRAGLDVPLSGWRLQPWVAVDNLLDRGYVASVVVNAFGGRFYEPGPGRNLRVGMRIRRVR